jgi:hypothetical protein
VCSFLAINTQHSDGLRFHEEHVYIKKTVFTDVMPCDFIRTDVSEGCISSINRVTKFGTNYQPKHAVKKYKEHLSSVLQLPVIPKVIHSLLILITLMMEVLRSSETFILITAT